jgi:hypothetical protein
MKNAVCNTCTVMLVRKAYERSPWLRLIREPLRFGMTAMARLYRIDAEEYHVRCEECRGCPRFLKTALKERSAIFRFLNEMINPLFDRILESRLTAEEIAESKRDAKSRTGPADEQPH